jgi:hypothetical protein
MESELPTDAKIVVGYAEKISKTIVAGGTVAAIVVGVRVLGLDTFKWHDVEVPLGYTAAVIGVLTIAHVFFVRFLILSLSQLVPYQHTQEDTNPDLFKAIFEEIRSKKWPFLHDMKSRSQPIRDRSHIWRMQDEPTTWAAYVLALVTFVAILPWRIDHGLRWAEPRWVIPAYGVVALILVVINWWVGGLWIINLSRMTDDPEVRESFRVEYGCSSGFSIPLMGSWYNMLMGLMSGLIVIIAIGIVIIMPSWWLWVLLGSVVASIWVVGGIAILLIMGIGTFDGQRVPPEVC